YHLIKKARDYKFRESAKLERAGKTGQIQALQDKVDTLLALCNGTEDLTELRARINSIFNDTEKRGVILSSVHRAKGDEAERVWILKPELMPHPMAQQEWELEQESNLKYVAYTRSKNKLIFVQSE
ncbi:MAG: ATP-binding domain-containing protein, partial [Gammaproteobacteria bacterium]|nr:ATP-binding domain-containing protein [Gammaproteobacteria bacterium]